MSDGHVFSICNALIDILVEVSDEDFNNLSIQKGVMHLVDHDRQQHLIQHVAKHTPVYELGGSAMNTTRTLASLGMKCMFFGTVGNDAFGTRILERMKDLGIESRVAVTDQPTGSCAILITPDGERTMNTFLGASLHYHDELIPHADIESARLLHVTGYQWSTDHQRKAVKQALAKAKSSGTTVSFDVADPFVVQAFRDDFLATIDEYADVVFANAQEAADLYQCDPMQAAAKIAASGAIAVIKLGAKGALICEGANKTQIDPVATQVIDTTAAGDMFAGGFLFGYLHGKPHAVSGKMAATLASDVISRIGAVVSSAAIARVRSMLEHA